MVLSHFITVFFFSYAAQKRSFPLRISSVNLQLPADLVTFAEEILNGNFIFYAVHRIYNLLLLYFSRVTYLSFLCNTRCWLIRVADFAQHFADPVRSMCRSTACISPLSDPPPQIDSESFDLRRYQALILNENIPLKILVNGLIVIYICCRKRVVFEAIRVVFRAQSNI